MNLEEYRKRIENAHTVTGFPSYWEQFQEMEKQRDKWRLLCEELMEAVTNEGPQPSFHKKILKKHSEEWPTLWKRIKRIKKALEEEKESVQ
jgi:hypothetical protein